MSALRALADDLESHAPAVDMELDAGIRRAVLILRASGIETFESCEGGAGHSMPDPTVRFWGGTWAGYRAFAVAMEHGLPVLHLRYCYTVVNGHLETPCWELTFHASVRDDRT